MGISTTAEAIEDIKAGKFVIIAATGVAADSDNNLYV